MGELLDYPSNSFYPEIDCEKEKKKAEKSSKENSMKFRKSSKIQRSFENLGGEIIGFAL